MSNQKNEQPPAAFRVFVSSTYTDMQQYREAIQSFDALMKLQEKIEKVQNNQK